jgi:competence protein ComGC
MNCAGTILLKAKEIHTVKGWGSSVRLAELRPHLAEFEREDQDYSLQQLQLDGCIVLMHCDDPQQKTPKDVEAELDIAGHKRHILYLKNY